MRGSTTSFKPFGFLFVLILGLISLPPPAAIAGPSCRSLYENRSPRDQLRYDTLGDESRPRETRELSLAEVRDLHAGLQEAIADENHGRPENGLPDLKHFSFYGEPISTRLGSGFRITNYAYFEATRKTSAHGAMRGIRSFFDGIYATQIQVIEPFAGIGHATHFFVKEGFDVRSFEIDPLTHRVGTNNLRRARTLDDADYRLGDGVEAIREMVRHRNTPKPSIKARVVYLDPPWVHGKNTGELHALDQYKTEFRSLLATAFTFADLVIVKRHSRSEKSWHEWTEWAKERGIRIWLGERDNNIFLAPPEG